MNAPIHNNLKNIQGREVNRQKRMQTHNSSNTATANLSVVKFLYSFAIFGKRFARIDLFLMSQLRNPIISSMS